MQRCSLWPISARQFRPASHGLNDAPVRWQHITASHAAGDFLIAKSTDLYPFGQPTSDRAKAVLHDLTWSLRDRPDEAWAVVGPSASAFVNATVFGQARADPPRSLVRPFLGQRYNIDDLTARVHFKTRLEAHGGGSGEFRDYTSRYYALREEETLTLRDHLLARADASVTSDQLNQSAALLNLDHLLPLPLVTLSNGQTRRARICLGLLKRPNLLCLEEPFTGLDASNRAHLTTMLHELHQTGSPRVLLVLRQNDPLPPWISHVIETGPSCAIAYQGLASAWTRQSDGKQTSGAERPKRVQGGKELVKLSKLQVKYADRPVLTNIDWTIRAGERWALKGPNGSGKSTVLSVILGDHPRSYTQSVELFGKPRASQATVQLRSQMGTVSPELYNAFPRKPAHSGGMTAREAIATGFDGIFSYRRRTQDQDDAIDRLLTDFDYSEVITENFLATLFSEHSSGAQSLILLLRALVSRAALIILDEPFAGMTADAIAKARHYLAHRLDDDQALVLISHHDEEFPDCITNTLHLDAGISRFE
ncbi:uncharacterized protein L969DRAFT_238412 [Mixia osmundae IAM 14324]|uniref:ABC transporter domain-containing protein n=1 Tax=Mixia osmundae (strain CBS 9802 / IAM 14324 / JCM 22182 / KY 12970) TaxID=764103 RepID=G7E2L0_MIXOS|nr:uncharacterized protein L969DRAFT_238412 [Mixia osmundae IAM 14324]KEI36938.1 hypothetical protein L969DRAFT_238412 [Mixia osmundae IAM 14324]GAA97070.1 hypothetical protein E5Q_03745 [Mixia osmundae IAM 14324]